MQKENSFMQCSSFEVNNPNFKINVNLKEDYIMLYFYFMHTIYETIPNLEPIITLLTKYIQAFISNFIWLLCLSDKKLYRKNASKIRF